MEYRNLTLEEIDVLEERNCRSTDWTQVFVSQTFDTDDLRNVSFEGEVHIGADTRIENVGIIRTTDGASYGEGVTISVLNEAGDGNIMLFSRLSSQLAALMVYASEDKLLFAKLRDMVTHYIERTVPSCTTIGTGVTIQDCRELTNVIVGDGCELCGASRLIDCTLSSTPDAAIYVGDDVILENVIAQAGATIVDGAKLYDTFVGEACHVGRGFTSENSIFFANSHMDNGEACAALCGPFSVSHHKSTLLIGGTYSFYNAGSNTNFSNHAYKMGPIHWGTMARGSKTASGAHILWPAKIGAFSMAMGKIQTHPDTEMLPFSYVIGEGRKTNVVPGRNLCTVGTYRDVTKWPKRDKRPANGRISLLTFDWLSPYVMEGVKAGIKYLKQLQSEQGVNREVYHGNGFDITASALQHGLEYYELALKMYGNNESGSDWTDLLGLLTPTDALEQMKEDIMSGDIADIEGLENRFTDIYESYEQWKGFGGNEGEMEQAHHTWLKMICRDAEREYDLGDVSEEQFRDFVSKIEN